jgi:hypothetical protein
MEEGERVLIARAASGLAFQPTGTWSLSAVKVASPGRELGVEPPGRVAVLVRLLHEEPLLAGPAGCEPRQREAAAPLPAAPRLVTDAPAVRPGT